MIRAIAIAATYGTLGVLTSMAWDRAVSSADASATPITVTKTIAYPAISYLPTVELPDTPVVITTSRPVPRPATTRVYSDSLLCLAHLIYFEGRGEPLEGQNAIAHVVLNRVASPAFPDNVCDVVHHARKRGVWQFSYIKDRPYMNLATDAERTSYATALVVAEEALAGRSTDPTKGATHYYNPHKVSPPWADKLAFHTEIGNHRFLE